jgi:hypothetical protein
MYWEVLCIIICIVILPSETTGDDLCYDFTNTFLMILVILS